jgi:uncharacterized protein (DUF433 family)
MAASKPKTTREPAASKSAKRVAKTAVKPTTSNPATISKSDFIRQQPASMSVAEVVAKGKAEGLKLSDSLVYMVRGPKSGKGKTKSAGAKKAPVAAKAPAPMSRADFVRQYPNLSAKEIVAEAKTAGLKLVESNVYDTRKYDDKKAVAKKTRAPKKTVSNAPAPKVASLKAPATMSKADFVRHYPALSAKEIVEKAKAEGMKLDPAVVYKVRGQDKQAAKRKGAAKKLTASSAAVTPLITPPVPSKPVAPTTRFPAPALTPAGDARIEELLRAAASALGFGRALEVIQAEQARLRAVLGA